MLAKLTVKNQLTLPKSVTQNLGPVQYFEVQEKAGQIILTPVRIQRGDALRAKLAELDIGKKTIESALSWAAEKPLSPRTAPKKSAAKPLKPAAKKVPAKTAARPRPPVSKKTAKA